MRFIVSRQQPKLNPSALISGIGVGAALMYYLDPNRGARRRSLLRDKLVHAASVTSEAVGTTKRDLANRARGLAAEARALGSDDDDYVDDDVLEARVRAQLGHAVSHPSAIEVKADNGNVTLTGDVLASEANRLMRRVSRVRGVEEVHSDLRVRQHPRGMPSLQDGNEHNEEELEPQRENWAPAARFLTSIAAGAMAMYGVARRDKFGSAVGLAGLALLTRGGVGRELSGAASVRGGRRGIHIQKTINIDAPVANVFAFLTDWERFPDWMTHVRSVRSLGGSGAVGERTQWEVDGPAGTSVEWNAVTMRLVPNKLIAWKSEKGEPIRQAGRIRLEANEDGGTCVHIELRYDPPGGQVGHAIASLFKRDPKHQMDDDLGRLKTVIETGRRPRDAAASRAKGRAKNETAPTEVPAPLELGPQ